MATEEDKTNTGALLTLVAVGTFLMIGISLAVTAYTREELGRATAEKEGPGGKAYQGLHGEQLAKLAAGTPIEQTMQEVVASLQRDPNSATPAGAATAVAPAPGSPAAAAGGAPGVGGGPGVAAGASSEPATPATPPGPEGKAVTPPAPSAAPAKLAPGNAPAPQKPVAPAVEPGKPKPPAAPAPAPPSSAHG